jgi:hypothetical protein
MVSTSGHALGSKQIASNSSSEITQDSDIDIIEHSDPDAKINRLDLGDNGGNSDDSQASADVSNDFPLFVGLFFLSIRQHTLVNNTFSHSIHLTDRYV